MEYWDKHLFGGGGLAVGRSFHWGFVTPGVGFLLSAVGLGVGGAGALWTSNGGRCRNKIELRSAI